MGKGIVKLGEGQWAVKDGNLLAAKETNGRFKNTEFTVSRGTRATYVGKDGLIKDASFYNLIDYSEDFSEWIDAGTTTILSNITNPSGGLQSYLLSSSSSSTNALRYDLSFSASTNYSYSLFFKAETSQEVRMQVYDGSSFFRLAINPLNNFEIVDQSSINSYLIEDFENDWKRVSINITSSSSASNGYLQIYPDRTGNLNGVYIYGGQLVEGTEALEYQYTNGKEGIPRIDFTDNTDGHLLLEPQRTNYIEYSNDASQWSDVVSNGTITSTSNYALAPNGENEATRLQLNSTTGYALKSEATTSFNDDYYISIYLKSNTTENQEVTIYGRNSLAISYTVTTQWQRFEVSCNNSSGSAFFNFGCRPSQGSDADLDILAWGGQLEQGTYTTSYIPTNGSTVTRDAETCTGAGSSADFNSEEGVLYLEIAALANDGTNRPISIGDGTTSNVVRFYYSVTDNRIVGNVKSGNSSVFNYNNVLSDATDFIKVAVSYKADDYKMYVNGINVSTDTSGAAPIGLTELAFDNGAGTDNFYGKCKAVRVYKEALSDTDLENLTS
jgi:hypothetical protein